MEAKTTTTITKSEFEHQRERLLKNGNAKLKALSGQTRCWSSMCPLRCISPLVGLPKVDREDLEEVVIERAKLQPGLKVYNGFTESARRFLYLWPDGQQLLPGRTLDTIVASGRLETKASTSVPQTRTRRGIFGFARAQTIKKKTAAQPHLGKDSPFVFERADSADDIALVQAWHVNLTEEFYSAFNVMPTNAASQLFEQEALNEFKTMLEKAFGKDNVKDEDIKYCEKHDAKSKNRAAVLVGTPDQLTLFLNSNPDLRLHYFKVENKKATNMGINVQVKNCFGRKEFKYDGLDKEHAMYTRISHQSMTMIQPLTQFYRDKEMGPIVAHLGRDNYQFSVKRSEFDDAKDRLGVWPLPEAKEINISLMKILGRGAFGTVVQVEVSDKDRKDVDPLVCALKLKALRANDNFDDEEGEAARERTAMFRIARCDKRHPFLVKGFFEREIENRKWTLKDGTPIPQQIVSAGLLLEVAIEGSLEGYVLKEAAISKFKPLDDNWLRVGRRFSAEMIEAVCALHALEIVHRDVKPENMLLKIGIDGELHICLTDYGTAKRYSNHAVKTAARGTEVYSAPEVPTPGQPSRSYTEKCDVYSLGVCVNVVFRRTKQWYRIENGNYHAGGEWKLSPTPTPEPAPAYPKELIGLITQMTSACAATRPCAADLKRHDFFKEIDWAKLVEQGSKE